MNNENIAQSREEFKDEIQGWQRPLPLKEVTIPKWPIGIFSEPFEEFVCELSRSTETPIELASMMMLAVVATAAHKKYVVQIKLNYCEPVNIWPMAILPPASRKSKVFSELTKPLREWEKREKELLEPKIQMVVSKRKTMEARIKELRNHAAKAKEDGFETISNEIHRMETEMPELLGYPQIWASDVTNEQLAVIMAANNEAMAILSDEGGVFDILMGLYSDGRANIDLFLQAHAGSPVRVDRGSRPPIFMEEPVLTIGLTVQPQVVKSICKHKSLRGRGLLGRFLFVIPPSNIGSRTLNEFPMEDGCRERFYRALEAILNHPTPDKERYVLSLSQGAYERWKEWAKAIEVMMSEEMGYLSHITDWAGKLPGAIGRIAGLIHIMRFAYGVPQQHEIGLDDMNAAIKVSHALISHALVVFDLLEEGGKMEMARKIQRWLKQERVTEFSRREVTRKFRGLKKEERDAILELLEEHESIRRKESMMKPGRPSELFDVNPYLFGEER